MDLLDVIKKHIKANSKGKQYIDWDRVCIEMNQHTGASLKKDAYRSKYRRLVVASKISKSEKQEIKANNASIKNSLKKLLKDPQTLDQLVEKTGLSDIQVLGYIGKLKNEGEEILDFGFQGEAVFVNTQKMIQTIPPSTYKHYHEIDKTIRIGLVSDTHMCNKSEQHTYLQMAYDDFKSLGISSVYHSGDLSDGYYQNRKGHIYELHKIGFDQQKDYIVKNYPSRSGIKTYFITGNHDYTHVDNGGSNIGPAVAKERSDMEYLGYAEATIMLSENVDMRLFHPDGGISYAYSYKPQKMVDTMTGGTKPKILIIGHYHKFFMMFYRNVWIICMPCFEAQTGFMMRNNLVAEVGYVVLELCVNKEGDIIDFNPHFKPFYKMLKEDYIH